VDPDEAGTFGFTDAQAKLTWSPSPRHSFRALVVGGRSLLHEADHPGPNALDTGANRAVASSLQWRFTPSARLAVNQQLYLVSADYQNLTPQGAVREGGTDRDLTWRGRLEWSSTQGRLEAGAQAQHLSADREAREFTLHGAVNELAVSGDTTNFAGWVHMSWNIAPRVTVSPGARVDRSGLAESTFASPWLLAEWQLTTRTRLRAGASVEHQSPLIEQAGLAASGVTLAPERARAWDVGLDYLAGGDWRVSAAVYHRRESDLLRLVGVESFVADGVIVAPAQPQWENTMSGRAEGIGVTVERRQANGLSGWLAYSYGRSHLSDAARNESFPADFDQRHTVNTYASYQWSGRTTVSARWRYGSNFPIQGYYEQRGIDYFLSTERNRERLPLYSRADVRVDRTFTRQRSRLTLFVEVLNLLNRTNEGPADRGYNPVTGRVPDLVEDLFPLLPTAGLLIEF
jgi:outer membrane cobalamin receptor